MCVYLSPPNERRGAKVLFNERMAENSKTDEIL